MSYSTTATSKFSLIKYSRAYPQKSHRPNLPVSEWQHFMNPALYVVLDKTKTHTGELESLRLRIMWIMNEGEDDDISSSQAPVILACHEDLDLFAFSAIEKNAPRKQHEEGLPLKAVCRDTLVGIRYLVSKDDAPQPVYRRFQMTFISSKDASDFAHAVRTVCPCKTVTGIPQGNTLNGAATMANILQYPQLTSSRTQSSTQAKPNPTDISVPTPLYQAQTTASEKFGPSNLSSASSIRHSDCATPTTFKNVPNLSRPGLTAAAVAADFTQVYSSATSSDLAPVQNSTFSRLAFSPESTSFSTRAPTNVRPEIPTKQSSTSQVMGPPTYIPAARPSRPPSAFDTTQDKFNGVQNQRTSQLPPSSPLPPSDQSAGFSRESHSTSSSQGGTTSQAEAMIASLRAATGLYDLSTEALEQVVAEIIREDGFVHLMERLSTMWRIHSLSGLSIS